MKFGGHTLRASTGPFRLADSAQLFREYLWESELWLRAVSAEFVTRQCCKTFAGFLGAGENCLSEVVSQNGSRRSC